MLELRGAPATQAEQQDSMNERILIVEDEADLSSIMAYNLERDGFSVRTALNGASALEALGQEPTPDLVLLDLMLPDMSGTEICRSMRQDARTREIPVIMVTARGEEVDRVVGFELGADDYVVKPFSVRELMLRVRAVLRRVSDAQAQPSEGIEFGSLTVDESAHRVTVAGDEVSITALEFRLLVTFLSRKGRVQTREQLLDDVWGHDVAVTMRTVDTHVKRLREKLGDAGEYIETVRGVGYRFREKPEEPVT